MMILKAIERYESLREGLECWLVVCLDLLYDHFFLPRVIFQCLVLIADVITFLEDLRRNGVGGYEYAVRGQRAMSVVMTMGKGLPVVGKRTNKGQELQVGLADS